MSNVRLNAKEKGFIPNQSFEAFNQTPIIKKVNDMTSLASNEQFAQPQVTIVNGVVKTTSKDVAAFFNKRHDNVMRDIRNRLSDMGEWGVLNFEETHYIDPQNGQTYTIFEMTKDGFTFVIQKFTGKEATAFQIAYIQRFNEMESTLKGETIPKLTRTTITPEQQATLHAIVDHRVNGFDSLRGGLWKRHNRHFGIAKYSQLLASRFDDAVVYLETAELRYPTPKNKLNDGYHFFVVKDGQSVYEKVIKADASGLTPDVLGSQPILLEHIRQVVGEFVGKGALPAPKPTLGINYPAITARPPKSFNANQHWFKADDFVDGNFDPVRDFLIGLETAGYEVTGLQIINQAKTWVIQQQAKAIKQIDKGYKCIADGLKLNNDYGMNVSGFVASKVSM